MTRRTVPTYRPDGLKQRLGSLERNVADLQRRGNPPPSHPEVEPYREILHWPGTVSDHVDVRNGPATFVRSGTIWKVLYVWDTAPSTDATVEWYFDDPAESAAATWTHTVASASGDEHTESESEAYVDEHIAGKVTTDGGGSGLTVYLYLR